MSDEEIEDMVFSHLSVHPHEMYSTYPERFWELFQRECPGVSREEMIRMLEESETCTE